MTAKSLAGGVLFLLGCEAPLGTCNAEVSVRGTWRYSAVQDAPAAARIGGTLEISAESCEGFQGRLDLLEEDLTGGTRRIAGAVTGRVVSATTLAFDAFIGPVPRQHIAVLRADSLDGTWVAAGGGGAPSFTGHFGARRETLP
jgi:hypothetical protein